MIEQRDLNIAITALKRIGLSTSRSLSEEERAKLTSAILDIQSQDPSTSKIGLDTAMEVIAKSPNARRQFGREIRAFGINLRGGVGKALSDVLEGEPEARPIFLYYCPKDPSHYRKSFFGPQDELTCPLHRIELELTGNG